MELTRNVVRNIASDVESALADIAAKYNVVIERGGASFTSDNATLKLKISTISADGVINSAEATDFNTYKTVYGVTKNLGESFYHNGTKYTITGLKPRSKKYPVIATNGSRSYKFPISTINNSPSEIN
jgi:hypothetical protein